MPRYRITLARKRSSTGEHLIVNIDAADPGTAAAKAIRQRPNYKVEQVREYVGLVKEDQE